MNGKREGLGAGGRRLHRSGGCRRRLTSVRTSATPDVSRDSRPGPGNTKGMESPSTCLPRISKESDCKTFVDSGPGARGIACLDPPRGKPRAARMLHLPASASSAPTDDRTHPTQISMQSIFEHKDRAPRSASFGRFRRASRPTAPAGRPVPGTGSTPERPAIGDVRAVVPHRDRPTGRPSTSPAIGSSQRLRPGRPTHGFIRRKPRSNSVLSIEQSALRLASFGRFHEPGRSAPPIARYGLRAISARARPGPFADVRPPLAAGLRDAPMYIMVSNRELRPAIPSPGRA